MARGGDAHRTTRKGPGPLPSTCSGLPPAAQCCPGRRPKLLAPSPSINSPGDYEEYRGGRRQRSPFTHGSVPGVGRAPHQLWGLPCQRRARQAFLTSQGQGRLLYFNNELNLDQAVATFPTEYSGIEAKGLAQGKPRSHSLLSARIRGAGRETRLLYLAALTLGLAYCLPVSGLSPDGGSPGGGWAQSAHRA